MQTAAPIAIYGHKPVGAAAAELTTNTARLNNGVSIKALAANAHDVFVGDSAVTTATGYPLSAGQEHLFRVMDASTLYVIGTAGTDAVAFEGS